MPVTDAAIEGSKFFQDSLRTDRVHSWRGRDLDPPRIVGLVDWRLSRWSDPYSEASVMTLGPCRHFVQCRTEAGAKRGETVLDLQVRPPDDIAGDKAVPFQLAKVLGDTL
jgi:hypothetical protein